MANKPRREMSTRRIAKSVRTHENTIQALQKASGWRSHTLAKGNRISFNMKDGGDSTFTPGEGHVMVDGVGPKENRGVRN